MCKKVNNKNCPNVRIDKCMKHCIRTLSQIMEGTPNKTLACCCGHGKYPISIVMRNPRGIYELFSNVDIPRTRNFYKRDKEGYYYIPEIHKPEK